MPEESVTEMRHERCTPRQHRQEAQEWEPPQEQLQTPAVCPQPAAVPDSATSAAAQHATTEMRWRRLPRTHADKLQQSLPGRLPLSLQQTLEVQQRESDESLADPAAQGTAHALRTPVATHASLEAAGDASTDLQWRRPPLARRPQAFLNSCTPGMAHFKGTELTSAFEMSYSEQPQSTKAHASEAQEYRCIGAADGHGRALAFQAR